MKKEYISLALLILLVGSMAGTMASPIIPTRNFNSSVIVFADKNDSIVSKSVNLLSNLFDQIVDYEVYYVDSFSSMVQSNEWHQDALAHIYIFHSNEYSIRIGSSTISWKFFANEIESTGVKNHFFIGCNSARITKYITNPHIHVKGFNETVDYFPATISTAAYFADIYDKVSENGFRLMDRIQKFINREDNYMKFVQRIITPKEVMKALHWNNTLYYKNKTLFNNYLLAALGLNTTEVKNFGLFQIVNNVYHFLTKGNLTTYLSASKIGKMIKAFLKGLSKTFKLSNTTNLKFGFLSVGSRIKTLVFSDDSLPMDVYAKIKQLYMTLTVKIAYHGEVNGIPITVYVKFNFYVYFDILLDYYASDHFHPDAEITSAYNGRMFVSKTGQPDSTIYKLVGYAKVPSPYGERTIEAWFSSTLKGVGFTRLYGGMVSMPGASFEFDLTKLSGSSDNNNKGNSTGSKILKFLKNLIPKVKVTGGDIVSLYLMFTGTDDGVNLMISLVENPISFGAEFKSSLKTNKSSIEVQLNVEVKLSIPMEGQMKFRSDKIILERLVTYFPVAFMKLHGHIKIKLGKKGLDKSFTLINRTGSNAFYFPTGKKVSPDSYIANVEAEYNNVFHINHGIRLFKVEYKPVPDVEIIMGSAFDHSPPYVTFMTPLAANDPSLHYDILQNIIQNISLFQIKKGKAKYIPLGDYVSSNLLSSGTLQAFVFMNKTTKISGDNATLRIYTFDEHPKVNGVWIMNNKVSKVFITVDDENAFLSNTTEVSVQRTLTATNPTYQYTFSRPKMYLMRAKIKVENPDPDKFFLVFLDNSGHVLRMVRIENGEIWTPWYSGNTIRFARGYFSINPKFINVDGEIVSTGGLQFEIPSTRPGASISIKILKIEYKAGIVWSSTDSSSSSHGYIKLKYSYRNTTGNGAVADKVGWKGIWYAYVDLYQRKLQGLENGWHTFYVFAVDNAGYTSKDEKVFLIDNPDDWEAPVITSNDQLNLDTQTPNYATAMDASTHSLYFTIEDRFLTLRYRNLQYGSGSTSYTVFSGINLNYAMDMMIAIDENSRVLRTVSSGTGNGFKFWFASDHAYNTPAGHEPQYSDRVDFRFAAKPLDSHWYIYIRVDTSAGSFYLTYKPGTFNPYYSNGYLFLPLNLEQGNWNLVKLDLLHDVRTVFPSATISTVDAFLARGNWYFDDISIDNTLYDDFEDGSTYGWQIYDSSPAGAKMYVTTDSKAMNVTMVSGITTKIYTTQFQGKTLIKKIIRKYTINLYDIVGPKYNSMLRLYITSGDNNGNTRTYGFWLPVYNEKPGTITVIQPTQSTLPGDSTINIKIRATDPNKISKVRISISDGHYAIMQYSSGYYVYSWRPSKEGSYKITFTIVDTYGFTTSKTINRYVGDFSGSINIISKIYSSKTQTVFLKIKATDPDGVGYIKVLVDNQYVGRMQYSSGYYTLLIHVGSYSNGLHTIKIIMYDHQGDKTTKTTTFYKIPDIHPPDDPIHS